MIPLINTSAEVKMVKAIFAVATSLSSICYLSMSLRSSLCSLTIYSWDTERLPGSWDASLNGQRLNYSTAILTLQA